MTEQEKLREAIKTSIKDSVKKYCDLYALPKPEEETYDEWNNKIMSILAERCWLKNSEVFPKTITNEQMAQAFGGYDFATNDMRNVCKAEQINMRRAGWRPVIEIKKKE